MYGEARLLIYEAREARLLIYGEARLLIYGEARLLIYGEARLSDLR